MGGMSLIFTPVLMRRLLGPPSLSGRMTGTFWTEMFQTILLKGITHVRPMLPPIHPLIHAICDITVRSCEKVAQNPVVLASYYRWSSNTSQRLL